jgi:hypothetical protein
MFAQWWNNGIIGALSILEQLGATALGDRYHMGKNCVVLANPYLYLRHM